MKIQLDYGEKGLRVEVPDKNLVKILSMKKSRPNSNPLKMVTLSLENPIAAPPLSALAQDKKNACIVICDITRPVPNKILLPPILKILENSGIKRENITILIATGIHRPNEGDELIYLIGEEIASNYRVINHFAQNMETHTFLGQTTKGTEVFVDSMYVNADLKITIGFIEPHLMAGFSGGRKLICPGISSLETVKVMHGPAILEHPNTREGIIDGNPFHEEALEIAQMAGVDFIVNVALNEDRKITRIFSGDLIKAHAEGVSFVRDHVKDTIPEAVDIVVTTSAGYPLDATYYQSIKGLTAALPIVKKGGTIILTAECREGMGSPEFSQLVTETYDITQFMKDIYRDDYFVVDQWQLEELVKVLRKAEVYLYADGISAEDKGKILITAVDTVEAGIFKALERQGESAKIAVIPKGPYILPVLG